MDIGWIEGRWLRRPLLAVGSCRALHPITNSSVCSQAFLLFQPQTKTSVFPLTGPFQNKSPALTSKHAAVTERSACGLLRRNPTPKPQTGFGSCPCAAPRWAPPVCSPEGKKCWVTSFVSDLTVVYIYVCPIIYTFWNFFFSLWKS